MSGKLHPDLDGHHYRVMIIKVQISLESSDGTSQMLIYNEDQSIRMQGAPGEDIVLTMQGRKKAFFEATVEYGTIRVGREVPDPGW